MNQYFNNNPNLKSQERIIKYNYGSSLYVFKSDNGLFSKNKIDYGSRLLLETYLKNSKPIHNFLDVGCGYGFLSIVLAKELKVEGLAIDVNEKALELTHQSALTNKASVNVLLSDAYQNITSTFDLIITNPPIHAGKKVVVNILEEAYNYLNSNGELWFIVHKDQGAKSLAQNLKNYAEIIVKEKKKGFYVFLAKKN